jgi:hypothetical protein
VRDPLESSGTGGRSRDGPSTSSAVGNARLLPDAPLDLGQAALHAVHSLGDAGQALVQLGAYAGEPVTQLGAYTGYFVKTSLTGW